MVKHCRFQFFTEELPLRYFYVVLKIKCVAVKKKRQTLSFLLCKLKKKYLVHNSKSIMIQCTCS